MIFRQMKKARFALLVLVAAAIWLPSLHVAYAPDRGRLRDAFAERQIDAWSRKNRDDLGAMRAANPEWDFMARTFTVLGLANRALRVGAGMEQERLLRTIDAIVDDTVASDARLGETHFQLPYAKRGPYVDPEARSIFVDGEILAMIAARDIVAPRAELAAEASVRAARIERQMRASPSLSGESYPDECWTFCNTTALAGLAMLDLARGSDHRDLMRAWVAHAKAHLTDPRTGLLVSSYTRDGRILQGPEGSSIWMTAHNLVVIDEAYAGDQYARARRELGATFLGFGWAREWPDSAPAKNADIDSGPIVPVLEASAGSSGLAVLGASAFRDEDYLRPLLASLDLAGYPDRDGTRYWASNEVGDAVLLYAFEAGPIFERVRRGARVKEASR
jgi:hypothetical protein